METVLVMLFIMLMTIIGIVLTIFSMIVDLVLSVIFKMLDFLNSEDENESS